MGNAERQRLGFILNQASRGHTRMTAKALAESAYVLAQDTMHTDLRTHGNHVDISTAAKDMISRCRAARRKRRRRRRSQERRR